MSSIISNSDAVVSLFQHYCSAIGERLFHPVTGAPIPLPLNVDSLKTSASLLNIYIYDPEVVMVWNNNFQPHHLDIWAPYIRSSKYRIAIVCRSMNEFDLIRQKLPYTPIWCLDRHIYAIQQLPVASSLKVFLYPDNEKNNEHTIHNYPRHMHVHIGHGDSDKSASANRFGVLYDYIFLADRNAISRYKRAGIEISDHRFLPIGAPTLPNLSPLEVLSFSEKNL